MDAAKDLQPAGAEGFEAWDQRVQAPEHMEVQVAFVSIRVGGTFGVNRAAYQMWGEPEAVRVMFDPKRRRIGLKAVDRSDPAAYVLRYPDSGVNITAKKFCEYYEIPLTETRRYTPKLVDGVLVIDL